MTNLPPGTSMADINGPPMLRCENPDCREEYNGYEDDVIRLCPDCREEQENQHGQD